MPDISKIKIDDVTYTIKDTAARSSVSVMTGASDTANGSAGSVPTPLAGDNVKFLRGDGQWEDYSPISLSLTLTVANWAENMQSVTALGVTPSNTVIVGAIPSSLDDYRNAGIECTIQGNDVLTFVAETTPTTAITVNALIFSNNGGSGSSSSSSSSLEWIMF